MQSGVSTSETKLAHRHTQKSLKMGTASGMGALGHSDGVVKLCLPCPSGFGNWLHSLWPLSSGQKPYSPRPWWGLWWEKHPSSLHVHIVRKSSLSESSPAHSSTSHCGLSVVYPVGQASVPGSPL